MSVIHPVLNVGLPAEGQTCPIGDYAAIGDGRSVALISRQGSLDWLCWPRFDSPAIFCKLLDAEKGGAWSIRPAEAFTSSRHYIGHTNVLETTFRTEQGVLRVIDFMPIADPSHAKQFLTPGQQIIRIVTCDQGQVSIIVEYAPRPNFSTHLSRIVEKGKLGLRLQFGGAMLALHSETPFILQPGIATATRVLSAGEEIAMSMTFSCDSPEVLPVLSDSRAALSRTLRWWEKWAAACTYKGRYADVVIRSILVLKLLEFPTSGAFLAAATTSLPEQVGGKKNWDYRFCWLRDASLIMSVLCGTGFVVEAEAFAEWLMHATRLSQPKLKIVCDVYGNPVPREKALSHLKGYAGSTPVNVGNAARGQQQLDTYGEVVTAVATLIQHLGKSNRDASRILAQFGKTVCKSWHRPDAGIWEVRGASVVHTHSRLLCWAALDALIRLGEQELLDGHKIDEFRMVRDQIRQAIETQSWIDADRTYTNEPGGVTLDATLLLISMFGFEPASSERMQSTFKRIRRDLGAGGPLLYRNLSEGLPAEGAFGICGFWAAEFLAIGGGPLEQAQECFEQLLGYANDVGLYAEETDPQTGAALGNFPQAFTHVGLVSAALAIERREREEQRGNAEAN